MAANDRDLFVAKYSFVVFQIGSRKTAAPNYSLIQSVNRNHSGSQLTVLYSFRRWFRLVTNFSCLPTNVFLSLLTRLSRLSPFSVRRSLAISASHCCKKAASRYSVFHFFPPLCFVLEFQANMNFKESTLRITKWIYAVSLSPLCAAVNALWAVKQHIAHPAQAKTTHHLRVEQAICYVSYVVTTVGPRNHHIEGPHLLEAVPETSQLRLVQVCLSTIGPSGAHQGIVGACVAPQQSLESLLLALRMRAFHRI